MNYKEVFEKISEESTSVIVVFFKGFRKIVIIPEILRLRFTSNNPTLGDEHISYVGVVDDAVGNMISYTTKIRYSSISAYVVFKSSYLGQNEIVTKKEFNKARSKILDEMELINLLLIGRE